MIDVKREDIPDWLVNDDAFEGEYDGRRWWTNSHLLICLSGQATEKDPRVRSLLDSPLVANATERLTPGTAVIQVPGFSADDLAEHEGPGGAIGHYKVEMAPGIWACLSYVAIVDYLYKGVEWFGRGSFEPMVARKNGVMVAVLMPAPLVLAYVEP